MRSQRLTWQERPSAGPGALKLCRPASEGPTCLVDPPLMQNTAVRTRDVNGMPALISKSLDIDGERWSPRINSRRRSLKVLPRLDSAAPGALPAAARRGSGLSAVL